MKYGFIDFLKFYRKLYLQFKIIIFMIFIEINGNLWSILGHNIPKKGKSIRICDCLSQMNLLTISRNSSCALLSSIIEFLS